MITLSFMQIIRGKNECGSGAELVEKVDKKISNDSRLNGKISFFLLKDPVSSSLFFFHT